MQQPSEPDWTRTCKAGDLRDLAGEPLMLRASADDASPWKLVKTGHDGFFEQTVPSDIPGEPDRTVRVEYLTVTFHDGTERVLNYDDDVEVGRFGTPADE